MTYLLASAGGRMTSVLLHTPATRPGLVALADHVLGAQVEVGKRIICFNAHFFLPTPLPITSIDT